jgi:hypothetical protein
VTGTVRTVDTDAIEVTDSTGAIVRVFVPRTANVTTPGLGGLAFGDPVSVTGTKAVDGSVTATTVTARPAGQDPSNTRWAGPAAPWGLWGRWSSPAPRDRSCWSSTICTGPTRARSRGAGRAMITR